MRISEWESGNFEKLPMNSCMAYLSLFKTTTTTHSTQNLNFPLSLKWSWVSLLYMAVILATWEAETGGWRVQLNLGFILKSWFKKKQNKTKKRKRKIRAVTLVELVNREVVTWRLNYICRDTSAGIWIKANSFTDLVWFAKTQSLVYHFSYALHKQCTKRPMVYYRAGHYWRFSYSL